MTFLSARSSFKKILAKTAVSSKENTRLSRRSVVVALSVTYASASDPPNRINALYNDKYKMSTLD